MSLERYVTPKCFFEWKEFNVSKERPDLVQKQMLTRMDKKVIRLGTQMILDPVREKCGKPVVILSAKRGDVLNAAIGGSDTSDHLSANAADFFVRNMEVQQVFCMMMSMYLPFRQCIYYPKKEFIHVSWNIPGKEYKRQVLILD